MPRNPWKRVTSPVKVLVFVRLYPLLFAVLLAKAIGVVCPVAELRTPPSVTREPVVAPVVNNVPLPLGRVAEKRIGGLIVPFGLLPRSTLSRASGTSWPASELKLIWLA